MGLLGFLAYIVLTIGGFIFAVFLAGFLIGLAIKGICCD